MTYNPDLTAPYFFGYMICVAISGVDPSPLNLITTSSRSSLLPMELIEGFAIPSVCVLIAFLSYSSQFLFYYLKPGPLTKREAIWFNLAVLAIWCCYYRACMVDPGPKELCQITVRDYQDGTGSEGQEVAPGTRWCKRCKAVKLPRSHHCKKCMRLVLEVPMSIKMPELMKPRCIPKMDHHW